MLLVIFGALEVRQSDYSKRRESATSSLSDMTGIGEQKKHSRAGPPALRSDGAEISGLSIVNYPLIFWKSYHCRSLLLDLAVPEKNLCRTLSKATKYLEITIVPPTGVLKLNLDFRRGTLRRIILHVHHPCSGFFSNAKSKPEMAAQIDAGINFFLWLTGRKYDSDCFRRAYSQRCPGPRSKKAAPLSEMYAYVKKQREEQRLLHLAEYAPYFRSWAGRYLQEDPTVIFSRGDSLAGAAVRKISRKISIARQRQLKKKKNSTAANSNKSLVSGPPKNRGLKGRHRKAQRDTRAPTSADDKYQQEADEVTPITIRANSD